MAVLGEHSPARLDAAAGSGLTGLLGTRPDGRPGVTLFVVGNYAARCRGELTDLVAAGHEIASHGPDHGRLPDDPGDLVDGSAGPGRCWRTWSNAGPRIPVPPVRHPRPMELGRYRDLLAEAGFGYVSDTHRLGSRSPVRELPVLAQFGIPIGGAAISVCCRRRASSAVPRSVATAVLYYHSYDFGATLPARSIRSLADGQAAGGSPGRSPNFTQILSRYGSKACGRCRAVISRPTSIAGPSGSPLSTRASRWPAFSAAGLFRPAGVSPSTTVWPSGPNGSSMSGAAADPCSHPWPQSGIHVTGIDPAEAMVALATSRRQPFPGLVDGRAARVGADRPTWMPTTWPSPSASSTTSGTVGASETDGRAARHVIGSFPSPGPPAQPAQGPLRGPRREVHGYGPTASTAWPSTRGWRWPSSARWTGPVTRSTSAAGLPQEDPPAQTGRPPGAEPDRSPTGCRAVSDEVLIGPRGDGEPPRTRRKVASWSSSSRCCHDPASSGCHPLHHEARTRGVVLFEEVSRLRPPRPARGHR